MSNAITLTEYLSQLEELEKKATKGPWVGDSNCEIIAINRRLPSMQLIAKLENLGALGDSFFIAESRSAIPKLIRMIRAMLTAQKIVHLEGELYSDLAKKNVFKPFDVLVEECERILNE